LFVLVVAGTLCYRGIIPIASQLDSDRAARLQCHVEKAAHIECWKGEAMAKRVLIVDDSKEVREIVTFALQSSGFEVVGAACGVQLQQMLSGGMEELPDLIILDVMMPGEDGFHICRNLRADPSTRHIPVMIITAHAEDIYQRISVDLGAASHLTKPFHPLELAERVKELLG
jgi:CheY-like chemotaxis protein